MQVCSFPFMIYMTLKPFHPSVSEMVFHLWIWTCPFFVNMGFSQWSYTRWHAIKIPMRWLILSNLIWIYTVCIGIGTGLQCWQGYHMYLANSRFKSAFKGKSQISTIAFLTEISLTNQSQNKNKMAAPNTLYLIKTLSDARYFSAIMSTICRVKGHKSFQIPENNSKLFGSATVNETSVFKSLELMPTTCLVKGCKSLQIQGNNIRFSLLFTWALERWCTLSTVAQS